MDPGQVEEHPDDMKILVDHAACLFAVLPPSWSLKMPLRRCSRVAVAICLFLDSATTTAICIGWKVEDIEWERVPYLLGCVAVATFVSMIRLVVFGGDAHQSSGAVQIVIVCGVLEAATLSAAITLVCLPQSARTCMEGKGPANICRFVVRHGFNESTHGQAN